MSTMSVSIPTDADGFVSQECPACRGRFKVRFGQGSGKPVGHCPYCAHAEEGCWWTPEQARYISALAGEQVLAPILDEFRRGMQSLNKPGSPIRITTTTSPKPTPRVPSEDNTRMPTATFACCNETIKHDGRSQALNCIACGRVAG